MLEIVTPDRSACFEPPVLLAEPFAVAPIVAWTEMPYGSLAPLPFVNFEFRMRPMRIPNLSARCPSRSNPLSCTRSELTFTNFEPYLKLLRSSD